MSIGRFSRFHTKLILFEYLHCTSCHLISFTILSWERSWILTHRKEEEIYFQMDTVSILGSCNVALEWSQEDHSIWKLDNVFRLGQCVLPSLLVTDNKSTFYLGLREGTHGEHMFKCRSIRRLSLGRPHHKTSSQDKTRPKLFTLQWLYTTSWVDSEGGGIGIALENSVQQPANSINRNEEEEDRRRSYLNHNCST